MIGEQASQRIAQTRGEIDSLLENLHRCGEWPTYRLALAEQARFGVANAIHSGYHVAIVEPLTYEPLGLSPRWRAVAV